MNIILLQTAAGTITQNKITWHWSSITSSTIMMALVGIVVVFIALLLLSVIYSYLPDILNLKFKRNYKKSQGRAPTKEEIDVPGEINAAIGAAIHLYFNEAHDFENTTLTINREVKRQSPWSDKGQMLVQHRVK